MARMPVLAMFLFLASWLIMESLGADLLCASCSDTLHPDTCTSFELCGKNEICYARGYLDHHDRHAYRLGCESREICNMYRNTMILGRRDSEAPPSLCFQCCDTPQCNAHLCAGGGHHTPMPWTLPPAGHHTDVTEWGWPSKPPTTVSTSSKAIQSTAPIQPSSTDSACQDQNTMCAIWYRSGQCAYDPGYMLVYCKRSCGQC